MAWSVPSHVAANGVIQSATTNAILDDLTLIGGPAQVTTPTWTNVTVGSAAVNTLRYVQVNKMVEIWVQFTFGSGSAFTGFVQFASPVPNFQLVHLAGWATGIDSSVSTTVPYDLRLDYFQAGTFGFRVPGSPSTSVTATAPFTWATGDTLTGYIRGETV